MNLLKKYWLLLLTVSSSVVTIITGILEYLPICVAIITLLCIAIAYLIYSNRANRREGCDCISPFGEILKTLEVFNAKCNHIQRDSIEDISHIKNTMKYMLNDFVRVLEGRFNGSNKYYACIKLVVNEKEEYSENYLKHFVSDEKYKNEYLNHEEQELKSHTIEKNSNLEAIIAENPKAAKAYINNDIKADKSYKSSFHDVFPDRELPYESVLTMPIAPAISSPNINSTHIIGFFIVYSKYKNGFHYKYDNFISDFLCDNLYGLLKIVRECAKNKVLGK